MKDSLTPSAPDQEQAPEDGQPPSLPNAGDIAAIHQQVERAGYRLTKATAKLLEFESPLGQVMYVEKNRATLNNINIFVHPGHDPQTLHGMEGVASLSGCHRFHSNMTRFPKRINRGKTATAYGWRLNIETIGDLPRFLGAFAAIKA